MIALRARAVPYNPSQTALYWSAGESNRAVVGRAVPDCCTRFWMLKVEGRSDPARCVGGGCCAARTAFEVVSGLEAPHLVIAVIGAVGLLVELLVLFGPIVGDAERKRKPCEQTVNRKR